MGSEQSPAIQAEHLGKSFQSRGERLDVLKDLDLSVARGETLVIMGPSGSGKSTLLHILGTLEQPTAGRVLIEGKDPFALKEPELAAFRNTTLGFVFQDHQLLPQCTALENVLLPTLVHKGAREPFAERARMLLGEVGLAERAGHRPAELSGGERQRVAIARAMINAPPILLCDEPTGNLDKHAGDNVAECLLRVQRQQGTTMIIVTHNEAFARRFGRILRLRESGLVAA